ncbi:allophanate hydrolase [Acidomonas methanolica]|uniref:Amidase/allophanate hydrolase n=1 Tax=Acidomonas methanolica NBRC 104435 TaxID=1231351 RepID=A0A023D906_ACIMT|nr:allophanate hydrolase [Acidomonas methanolica]MBU2655569.1 allophanate hydrolase [Acidomonas methanolica]TCS21577.1 allophanate hydrolase [Acidomonas methanolica]GAJ30613.1 amidase/allophanate hydrolase [Acidomonas methanolica NBRC 104435]GBQ45790.1 allophanate hydrolase [Acidomonas methanolica]GEL00363.1 allophanate hydrolase [Acidomonas methanolica NBRC 104435]
MWTELPDLAPRTLRNAYRNGALAPRAVIDALRVKCRSLNEEYRAFIHILDEMETEPFLRRLDMAEPDDLPLYGVPFAVKDNIDIAGIPTTAACPAYSYVPDDTATIVRQLVELGAIPIAKTNLDQFATGLNGTRSPYGVCRNSVLADFPAGGSSSGSALAVALGVASFALGTDTAGSGRIPAAYNNLVGLKATRGLLSTHGVVPACRTLDCTTLLTATASEASMLLALLAKHDMADDYSRPNPHWNGSTSFGALRPGFRFGVPDALDFAGCPESGKLFSEAVTRLEELGGIPTPIDLSSFLEAARLLYEGPWVAERYLVVQKLLKTDPNAVLPVIRNVLDAAPDYTAADVFAAVYRLQHLKTRCDVTMNGVDFVLTPSMPRPVSLAELRAEPVAANSLLGMYTNFMNLLDYAAVAVPSAFMSNGLPWGITIFGRAFTDQYLLSVADAFQRASDLSLAAGRALEPAVTTRCAGNDRARIVVCGAHLDGLALNWQMRDRGARLVRVTTTAPCYRFYVLPGGPPMRPGLERCETGGRAIDVEVWEMPSSELGSFLTQIPAPLGLGKIELSDGSVETGFICEGSALKTAKDVTATGGWRAWLASADG